MKRYEVAILLATGYLVLYVILFQAALPLWILNILFVLSPFVVLYMVYQVLSNAEYKGKELEEGEEYGYEDVDKETLGIF